MEILVNHSGGDGSGGGGGGGGWVTWTEKHLGWYSRRCRARYYYNYHHSPVSLAALDVFGRVQHPLKSGLGHLLSYGEGEADGESGQQILDPGIVEILVRQKIRQL